MNSADNRDEPLTRVTSRDLFEKPATSAHVRLCAQVVARAKRIMNVSRFIAVEEQRAE